MEQVPTVIEHGQQIADRHVVVRLFFRWTTWKGLHPDIDDHIKGAKLDRPHKKDHLTAWQLYSVWGRPTIHEPALLPHPYLDRDKTAYTNESEDMYTTTE